MVSKKIEVQADESPELVAVFNPWQKARETAEKAKKATTVTGARIKSRINVAAGAKTTSQRRWLRKKTIIGLIIVLLIIVGGFEIYHLLTRPADPIAPALQAELPFSPYIIPKGTSGYFTYNYRVTNSGSQSKILSYDITTPDNTTVSLSEYVLPKQFNEGNNKTLFLKSINQYDTVQTAGGTIYVGRIQKLNKQIGAMIGHNILVLMSPSENITNTQWNLLGDKIKLL